MRSAALIALLVVSVVSCTRPDRGAGAPPGPDAVVATVNGEPIVARELDDFVARERAGVFAHFKRQYGVDDSPGFWTTPHGGERPIDVVKQRALDAAVRTKLQHVWMREAGLLKDVSYAGFLQRLDAENERRRNALARGEVIYGPQQFGRSEYFAYVLANGVLELKAKVWAEVPDAELRRYHEATAAAGTPSEPFDEVKNRLRPGYVDAKYRDELARRVAAARVEVVRGVLDRLEVK